MKRTKLEMLKSCISKSEARRINFQVKGDASMKDFIGIDGMFIQKMSEETDAPHS